MPSMLSLLLVSSAMLPSASAAPVFSRETPGKYIILLKDGSAATAGDILAKHGGRVEKVLEKAKGVSAELDAMMLQALRADPDVAVVEPDYEVHAFAFRQAVQITPTGINRADAELNPVAKINTIDERVNADIAVLDTGIDEDHVDLNLYRQVNFSNDLSDNDRNGHGTHVAGTAAALDNGTGVVGMAPGARLWSVKVLDSRGSGSMSDIVQGLDYVTAHADEIEVANMSLGCNCVSQALNQAIDRAVAAGVVVVVAAGNDGRDASSYSPANHPKVITVSAIADYNGLPGGGARATCYADKDDTLANFSNYGPAVDIAAPGVCITSTWKGGRYETISGTSMASPHVAGGVGLYLSSRSKPQSAADVEAVSTALKQAAFPQSSINGFTEDRDAHAEPVLNVAGL
jgi:subtilisin